ncbi:MAG: glutamate--tRNA ligase [bacterium]
MTVRLRFAPSPTGNLHLGTLRAALFNWLYAQKKKGVFLCRIEDTDLQRSEARFEDSIFEGLAWLGLTCDESPMVGGDFGPYRQSERRGIYQTYIDQLIESGYAYYCFATPEDLEAEREEAKKAKKPYVYSGKYRDYFLDEAKQRVQAGEKAVLRFKMPQSGTVTVHDLIRGEVTFDYALIGDFILQKSDGTPAFNFAVVVDDALMNITHVIRGEDHLSNMPRQLAVFEALGFEPPQFAHLPMILGADKSKLSKRHGATNVIEYKEQGFLPEAMLNYLALLGWTPFGGHEKLPLQDLIQAFDIDQVNSSGAVFDVKKLSWLNGQYIRDLSATDFQHRVVPFIATTVMNKLKDLYNDLQLQQIMGLAQASITFLTEMEDFLQVFIEEDRAYQQRLNALGFKPEEQAFLSLFTQKVTGLDAAFSAQDMKVILEEIVAETGLGKGKVFRPIRIAMTGFQSGPDLMQVLALLGKGCLLRRLGMLIG